MRQPALIALGVGVFVLVVVVYSTSGGPTADAGAPTTFSGGLRTPSVTAAADGDLGSAAGSDVGVGSASGVECDPSDSGSNPIMASGSAADSTPQVQVDTSLGTFVLELYHKHAPLACQNFLALTQRGYYNGVVFHRIIAVRLRQGPTPAAVRIPGGCCPSVRAHKPGG